MPIGGSYTEIAVATTDTQLLPQSAHRHCIYINNPTANALYIAFGKVATVASSWIVPPNTRGQEFYRDDLGGLIDGDVHAIFATAPGNVAVIVGYET